MSVGTRERRRKPHRTCDGGTVTNQTEVDSEFGPPMRGRSSPFARRPLEMPAPPLQPGGGRRRSTGGRGRRAARRVLGTFTVLLLVVVLSGVGLLLYVSGRIERHEVDGLQGSRPLNILVTGTDSREGLTREQRNELTTGSEGGNLTDTIFVLQAGGGNASMLAFPRDLYVTRCDGSQGRINAAVAIGGASCLVQTITQTSGIEITHHLQVNFLGFRDIVDAVGGVEICLDQPIVDVQSGLDLPAGCQLLDGVDALGFVRVRKIDNDLQRIKRQQQFVKALADKVLSRDTLTSPSKALGTATTMADAVTADDGFGPFDLARTGWALRGLASGLENTYTVPATDAIVGGASVLQMQQPAAQALFEAFSSGELLEEAQDAAGAPTPEQIQVAVLNGARVAGLAGRVAEQVRAAGFVVREVGNSPQHESTLIRYPPGQRAAAEVLRDASGRAAELVEDPSVSAVALDLGTDAADGP